MKIIKKNLDKPKNMLSHERNYIYTLLDVERITTARGKYQLFYGR